MSTSIKGVLMLTEFLVFWPERCKSTLESYDAAYKYFDSALL